MLAVVTTIGILAIRSANSEYMSKQLIGALLGVFIMVVISLFDYHLFLKLYWPIYAANLVLLAMVYFFGETINNAKRWVTIAGIRFQPSEAAKILLILFFAQFIMKHKERFNTLPTLAAIVLLFLPPWVLVYKQPDLSTSIMLIVVFCVLLFVGGLSYRIILGTLAVVIPLAIIFLNLVLQPDQTLIKDYQQGRIMAWLNPSEYENAEGYQQTNSMIAIGSGQLTGKGLNNNEIASVKNGNFISEPQTDFIFAIIGEELGFIGSTTVIVLLFLISGYCIMVAMKAPDIEGKLICTGVASVVGFQSFFNIAVTTGLMPNTGLPLPFVSYGLTSLITLYASMGFVLNVRLQGVRKYT
ncbi:MAG: rod shape-determining protein RodA [Lachnospiraceae bacterium]|nr:rod shape-determining protein RodA [Lachnospiraceae bacterium]